MRHVGLFEGIGGFSYAARKMGWETVAWCEWNPFCQQVLKYHFPKAQAHEDITKTDFTIYRGTIDILTGGFPCQPYSIAGKRKGKEDERHLWPEMLRAAREIQPRWIVGENVPGLVNWNGGLVFNEVCADLESEGYEVQPVILPACAVNAPHRRDRVWFVAYSKNYGQNGRKNFGGIGKRQNVPNQQGRNETLRRESGGFNSNRESQQHQSRILGEVGTEKQGQFGGSVKCCTSPNSSGKQNIRERQGGFQSEPSQYDTNASYSSCERSQGQGQHRRSCDTTQNGNRKEHRTEHGGQFEEHWFEAATRLCVVDDGISGRLDASAISKGKWRTESLKAAGNAIVWQVAFEIYKTINEYENLIKNS